MVFAWHDYSTAFPAHASVIFLFRDDQKNKDERMRGQRKMIKILFRIFRRVFLIPDPDCGLFRMLALCVYDFYHHLQYAAVPREGIAYG